MKFFLWAIPVAIGVKSAGVLKRLISEFGILNNFIIMNMFFAKSFSKAFSAPLFNLIISY
ncbi:hypothetical protein AAW28_03220 [Lacticaseibacillus casei]|nr:hypothetical protein AAW28_03220 [Lacticaseibacillus casei]